MAVDLLPKYATVFNRINSIFGSTLREKATVRDVKTGLKITERPLLEDTREDFIEQERILLHNFAGEKYNKLNDIKEAREKAGNPMSPQEIQQELQGINQEIIEEIAGTYRRITEECNNQKYGGKFLGRFFKLLNNKPWVNSLIKGAVGGAAIAASVASFMTGPAAMALSPLLFSVGAGMIGHGGLEFFQSPFRGRERSHLEKTTRLMEDKMKQEIANILAGPDAENKLKDFLETQFTFEINNILQQAETLKEKQRKDRIRNWVVGVPAGIAVATALNGGIPVGWQDFDFDKIHHQVKLTWEGMKYLSPRYGWQLFGEGGSIIRDALGNVKNAIVSEGGKFVEYIIKPIK